MESIRLTHIGGPTTLIEIGQYRILTDPTFDAPGRTYKFGWGTRSTKVAGPALAISDLPPIDTVLLSHDQHADNLDSVGRSILPAAREVVTTVTGAQRLGGNARGLAAWSVTRLERPGVASIEVTATPCRHGPPGSRPLTGDVIGFALRWAGQRHGAVWISGDTVFYRGVRKVAERLRVGTLLLHLGGVRFPVTGPLRYTMQGSDVDRLVRLMNPRTVVLTHYEGWSHFESVSSLEHAIAMMSPDTRARLKSTRPGEPTELLV